MNQDIQQRIEEAAQKHGKRIDGEHPSHAAEDFTYGANFALNTILPEEMGRFAEWLDQGPWVYWKNENIWTNSNIPHGDGITTPQLIELFKNRE